MPSLHVAKGTENVISGLGKIAAGKVLSDITIRETTCEEPSSVH